MSVTTGAANLTIIIDPDDGCEHPELVPLGCEPHAYKHMNGVACLGCGKQFWKSWVLWCEETGKAGSTP